MSLIEEKCSNSSSVGSNLQIKNIAETPYTLLAEDTGKFLMANTDQIIIPEGLPIGFNVSVCQVHPTQQVLFTPDGAAVMNEPDSKNKTAKQHATVSLVCVADNIYQLFGYTN